MIQFDTILEPRELLEVLRSDQRLEFKALLRTQPETVVDAAFEEANFEERLEFLRLMPIEKAAHGFTDLPMPEQVAVITTTPAEIAETRPRVPAALETVAMGPPLVQVQLEVMSCVSPSLHTPLALKVMRVSFAMRGCGGEICTSASVGWASGRRVALSGSKLR